MVVEAVCGRNVPQHQTNILLLIISGRLGVAGVCTHDLLNISQTPVIESLMLRSSHLFDSVATKLGKKTKFVHIIKTSTVLNHLCTPDINSG